MNNILFYCLSGLCTLGILIGIAMMSKVKTAKAGNLLSAFCVLGAVLIILIHHHILSHWYLYLFMAIGLVIGLVWAAKVNMIEMPQTVALLNGFGGAASAIVAIIALIHDAGASLWTTNTGMLALVVGTVTLTGSLVAAGKLAKVLPQKPVVLKGHSMWTLCALALSVASIAFPYFMSNVLAIVLAVVFSAALGILFAIRVGGADMPITISLLNSLSGVAGSIAGMAISDVLLCAVGGIVGASGLILTRIMCVAMNRKLIGILIPKSIPAGKVETEETEAPQEEAPVEEITEEAVAIDPAEVLRAAQKVIIVPGYGMALAQAQEHVKALADKLEATGKEVKYAIHPVAGRMPGHMNVLLCEVDVPYDQLYEMDSINPEFAETDVVIVIGANDVMNPAANTAVGTPIYGMPVLQVEDAKHIIVCNFDLHPGYAGVPNPLYMKTSGVSLLLGDAKETVTQLTKNL